MAASNALVLAVSVVICSLHLSLSSPTLTATPPNVTPGHTAKLTLQCSALPDHKISSIFNLGIYFTPDIPNPSITTTAAATHAQQPIHRKRRNFVIGGNVIPVSATTTPPMWVVNPVTSGTPQVFNPVFPGTTSTPHVINPITSGTTQNAKTSTQQQSPRVTSASPSSSPTLATTTTQSTGTTAPQPQQMIALLNAFIGLKKSPYYSIQATGNIGGNQGESNLTVIIDQPSDLNTGRYECQASGLDSSSMAAIVKGYTTVGLDKPSLSDLQNIIPKLEASIRNLELRWNNIDNSSVFHHSNVYTNRKYILSRSQVQGIDLCQFICTVQGGYLAEIDDFAEFEFVRKFVSSRLSNDPNFPVVFLGAADHSQKGDWKFLLHPQQAPYLGTFSPTGYDCLTLTQTSGFRFSDQECDGSYRFICEIPV